MKSENLKKNVNCTNRRCSQIKLQLKVEQEDGREVP